MDAIFIVCQLQEKYIAAKKPLYFAFVDLEKALDHVPRKVLWWVLRSLGVDEWAVWVIQGKYAKAWSLVRVSGQYNKDFGVGVGVHQGSVLRPLLFILVLEVLSREFRTGVPWELFYADDLVLIVDTQLWPRGVYLQAQVWKAGMESKWLRVNMKKKFLVSGNDQDVLQKSGKCLCAVSCSGDCRNSILCSQCMLWVHKTCSGITKRLVTDPNYICPTVGVRVSLGPSMAELWLKWMSTAPCLMWKPLAATLVICCAPVGAVAVSLLPDAVWPGKVQETLACPNLQPPLTQVTRQSVCGLCWHRGHYIGPWLLATQIVMAMYNGPHTVSNLSQTFRFPAPERKEGPRRHGLNAWR